MFFILFLVHIPIMSLYAGYGYYDSGLEMLTLGNLGFSEAHCQLFDSVMPLEGEAYKPISLECGSGMIDQLLDFGVTTKYEN